MGAATARGVTRGTLGLPGDLESLVRMLTGGKQQLPTSEDWDKKLPSMSYLANETPKERSPFDSIGQFYNVPIYGGAINTGVKTIPKAIDTFTRPKVTNSIYSMMPGAPLRDTKYVQRNINGPDEIDDILSSGFMLPKKGGKNQKYFTATNEVNTNSSGKNVVRIDRSKVPSNRAVRAKDVELFNRETNTWEPITKKFMGKDVLENPGRREFAKKAGAIGLGSTALAKALKYLDELEKATPAAKQVEDAAPVAKAATKYKYNSLKEYNDALNENALYRGDALASQYGDDTSNYVLAEKAKIAKADEIDYNSHKWMSKTYNEPGRKLNDLQTKLRDNANKYLEENSFSPQAKAEMKQFKTDMNPFSKQDSHRMWEYLDDYVNNQIPF